MRSTLLAVSLFLAACGQAASLPAGAEAPTAIEAREPPPLSVTFHYDDEQSALGWGNLDLTARPMEHEIRVDLMVGAPVRDARWRYCGAGRLYVDGRQTWLPLEWRGVPMAGGVYDAVSVDITIEDVRRMATAEDVEVELCGDRVTLTSDQRAALPDFVRRFEEMATYDGPTPPEPRPTLDREPRAPRLESAPTEA